jgi:alpha-1,6-mannosyltransferase
MSWVGYLSTYTARTEGLFEGQTDVGLAAELHAGRGDARDDRLVQGASLIVSDRRPAAGAGGFVFSTGGLSGRFNTWVTALGAINTACFATYAVLSYGMAPAASFGTGAGHEREVFGALAQPLSFLGPGVESFFRGHSALARREVFLLAYGLPVLISSVVFVTLLFLLARHRGDLDPRSPRLLFRWAVACAVLSMLATPVLVPDFWWYVAWGRMVADGTNPYYTAMTLEMVRELPLNAPGRDSGLSRFAYGPIWAMVCGVAVWLAGGNGVVAGVLLKLVLTVAWCGSLYLIWLLLKQHTLWRQCIGMVIFGWLPLSLLHAVADGHNDVFMLLFVLLWLYGLQRGQAVQATVGLATSALVKYMTAPLLVLDLLHVQFSSKRRLVDYWPQAVAGVALALLAFGPFVRSIDAFGATLGMQNWTFFTPRHAVFELERLLKLKPELFRFVPAVFVLLAMYSIANYVRRPTLETFWKATLAILCGVLFSIGHNWPWFLLWVLGPAALVAGSGLTRWLVGVALAAPFAILVLVLHRGLQPSAFDPWGHTGLVLYVFALLWFLFVPRGWFQASSASDRPMSEPAAA